jgi:hypothetical protein
VVVAVGAVRVVQVAVHEVIDVIAVRDRLVAAAGAVNVILRVASALVCGGAGVRVRPRHFDGVLFDRPG